MENRSVTVSQLLSEIRASSNIQRNIKGMQAYTEITSESEHGTADLSSYIESSLRIGRSSANGSTERFLYDAISQQIGRDTLDQMIRSALSAEDNGKLIVSPGLLAAFKDARNIRRETGGKDTYIGARHVLVAIVTSTDKDISLERSALIGAVGSFDLQKLAVPLAARIQAALERGERIEAWQSVFASRGFDEAARRLGSLPPTPRPFSPETIARLKNDDPATLDEAEIVGDDEVASALARVIAARDFGPPVAIGVFGHWGSGKSLFLRRVRASIDEIQEAGGGSSLRGIVPIGFNAWHYVDTDLWANLVGHIFEALDSAVSDGTAKPGDGLLDQLTTARELALDAARSLVERRQAAHDARARLRNAEDGLSHHRHGFAEVLRQLAGKRADLVVDGRRLVDSESVRTVIRDTYGRSIEDMAARWSGPTEAAASLRRSGLIWLEIRRRLGTGWSLSIVAGATILCVIVPHLASAAPSWLPPLPAWLTRLDPASLAWTGFLTATAGRVAVVTRKAVVVRDAAVATIEAYRHLAVHLSPDETDELAAARQRLDRAEGNVEQARRALSEAVDRQAAASADLAAQTPAQRLKSFVRDRAALDGPYRSREGLIGTIRRDFADLTTLMHSESDSGAESQVLASAAAYKARLHELDHAFAGALTAAELQDLSPPALETVPRSFKRIVLYIDDLDRCPADKVVDVLQAVHMLLAFPLFVVIVAVDVRWLEGALKDRYRQLAEQGAAQGDGRVAALDYLEKIFQLAVWTQPIGPADVNRLVRLRFLVDADGAAASTSGGAPTRPVQRLPPSSRPEPDRSPDPVVLPAPSAPLRVTEFEISFLERTVGSLDLSPRRLLRLINSYQVARTSLSKEQTDDLLAGGFKGMIGILSVSSAAPMRFGFIADAVVSCEDWQSFEAGLRTHMTAIQIEALLSRWMKHLERESVSPLELRPHVSLARRFSFSGPRRD